MKAVALTHYLPINNPKSLMDVDIAEPQPQEHDLLVEVKAVSVNPVDTKVRAPKATVETSPKVIGYDAAGVVVAKGKNTHLFNIGDEVYYAGDITRPGTNSAIHAVDERIVGRKPRNLSFAQAAALPLTSITAYESLFHRLNIDINGDKSHDQTILIIGGAGGVGSIAIQLARLAQLTVIATASRPETKEWVSELGAQHTADHHDLMKSIQAIGFTQIDHIAIFNNTIAHWPCAVNLIRPQGRIVTIDETSAAMPMDDMKKKSASLHWEFMFTRSMYKTSDMIEQHHALNHLSTLIEEEKIRTTMRNCLHPINAENLRKAHTMVESGTSIGKIVIDGGFA